MTKLEYYQTTTIRGYRYRIENDDVSFRVAIEDMKANKNQWIGLRITQGLKIVVDRWNDGINDDDGDREYILNDDEESKKVQKAINNGRLLLTKLKQVQQDEEQAALVGSDIDDLEYDLMIFVGKLFEEFGTGSLPEAVEEALNL